MTKDWIEAKTKEAISQVETIKNQLVDKILLLDNKEDQTELLNDLQTCDDDLFSLDLHTSMMQIFHEESIYEEIASLSDKLRKQLYTAHSYSSYLDSDPVEFDGDIIITDPCYIMRENHTDYLSSPSWWNYVTKTRREVKDGKELCYPPRPEDYPDFDGDKSPTLQAEWDEYHKAEAKWQSENVTDWERCDYGDNMEVLGFTSQRYMTRSTLYGDWSCTTFDLNTKEEIGGFCADAGLVSVFLLDDILRYNPDYKDHLEKSWCATHIKDFKGTVQFVVKEVTDEYEDDSEYHKKGDTWTDYQVEVVGHGVNKVTGELIDFVGKQTGF